MAGTEPIATALPRAPTAVVAAAAVPRRTRWRCCFPGLASTPGLSRSSPRWECGGGSPCCLARRARTSSCADVPRPQAPPVDADAGCGGGNPPPPPAEELPGVAGCGVGELPAPPAKVARRRGGQRRTTRHGQHLCVCGCQTIQRNIVRVNEAAETAESPEPKRTPATPTAAPGIRTRGPAGVLAAGPCQASGTRGPHRDDRERSGPAHSPGCPGHCGDGSDWTGVSACVADRAGQSEWQAQAATGCPAQNSHQASTCRQQQVERRCQTTHRPRPHGGGGLCAEPVPAHLNVQARAHTAPAARTAPRARRHNLAAHAWAHAQLQAQAWARQQPGLAHAGRRALPARAKKDGTLPDSLPKPCARQVHTAGRVTGRQKRPRRPWCSSARTTRASPPCFRPQLQVSRGCQPASLALAQHGCGCPRMTVDGCGWRMVWLCC